MGLSLYKAELTHLADLSPEDIDAIESHVYHADDGTYYLQERELDDLKLHITPELYADLKAELDKNEDVTLLLS